MEELLHCCVFLLLVTVSAGDSVDRKVGESIELPCPVPDGTVLVLEWTTSDRYLLFYRDGKIIERYQDAQFRNRVQLPDLKMNGGDLGVTLEKLTRDDSGTYTCEALVKTSGGEREVFAHSTQLFVEESPPIEAVMASNNDKEMMQAVIMPEQSSHEKQASAHSNDNGFTAVGLGLSVCAIIVLVLAVGVFTYLGKKSIKLGCLKEKRPIPQSATLQAKEPLNCPV